MSDRPASLVEQAEAFAGDLASLLVDVLPHAPGVVAEVAGDRVVVRPEDDVPIFVSGERLASLEVHLRCRLDSRGLWLAVESSLYKLRLDLDRTPLLRVDYMRESHSAPCAHLQVHAHRGALTHLLSQAGHPQAHDMSKLHLPVGGARYRPCLEDLLQFLVQECGVDAVAGWRDAVYAGRTRWRQTQARAVTRDFPREAAETLRRMGYTVTEPAGGEPDTSATAATAW